MEGNGVQEPSGDFQLKLKGDKTLKIQGDNLIVHDRAQTQSTLLYEVLWAELTDNRLNIEYAVPSSKTSYQPVKWTFEVEENVPNQEAVDFVATLLHKAYGSAQMRRRAFVLINPNSGPGHGVKKWETVVRPLFEAARVQFDVMTLERGGQAMDLAEQVDIMKYDTIVACSGDGTPHEIFNGLAKRKDAKTALAKIAVSHIPCGSGNAMACNLYGSHRPAFAALAIIKGIITPLDLVSITQGGNRKLSFLSQALGIIAESDLGTEHLRWMGSARFDIGVISRLFRKRCYPCDVALKIEVDGKMAVKSHYKRYMDGKDPQVSLSDDGMNDNIDIGLPPLKYGTEQDKLPDNWENISYNKIGNFYCGNMAYMAPDLNFFSATIPSDGCMDLITVNGDLSPPTALKTILSVESGKFFDNPHVSYRKVSAYRITPRDQKDGYISIDGEKLPFGPFQAEVHRGLGRVISKRGRFEAAGPLNWNKFESKDETCS